MKRTPIEDYYPENPPPYLAILGVALGLIILITIIGECV